MRHGSERAPRRERSLGKADFKVDFSVPLLAVLHEGQEGPRLRLVPREAAGEAPGMLGEGSGAERGTRPGEKGEKHQELMPSHPGC